MYDVLDNLEDTNIELDQRAKKKKRGKKSKKSKKPQTPQITQVPKPPTPMVSDEKKEKKETLPPVPASRGEEKRGDKSLDVKSLEEDEEKKSSTNHDSASAQRSGFFTISEHREFMRSLYEGNDGDVEILIDSTVELTDEEKWRRKCVEKKDEETKEQIKPTRVIKVHEELLHKHSTIFSKMLKPGFEEYLTKRIDMTAYKGRIVSDFVKFLYLEEQPDFNHYLSRPDLFFSTIKFCQQFFLEKYCIMFVEQIKTIISSLESLASVELAKELQYYSLFERYKFDECYKIWHPYTYTDNFIKGKSNVHQAIFKCMHFVVENYEQICAIETGIDIRKFIWKFVKIYVCRSRRDWSPSCTFSDNFVKVLSATFKTWLEKNSKENMGDMITLMLE